MLIIIIIIKSGASSGAATPCWGAKTKRIKKKRKSLMPHLVPRLLVVELHLLHNLHKLKQIIMIKKARCPVWWRDFREHSEDI